MNDDRALIHKLTTVDWKMEIFGVVDTGCDWHGETKSNLDVSGTAEKKI
jgi:hypothetical protein